MTYRIILSGGGTVGSVTPLLALAEEIRSRSIDVEFLFVGTVTGPERVLVEAANISFIPISAGKLRRYWSIQNFADLGRLWQGYRQAKKILRDWRPYVVVSAGSFVSVPLVWAARQQGIATLVHQQDIRPGLANRLMAPAADVLTATFQASAEKFRGRKVVVIGNPVRTEILTGNIEQAKELFHLTDTKPVLLVLGGGTGSERLNTLIGNMAEELARRWSIIHLTGSEREWSRPDFSGYQSHRFLTTELPHALAVADVVISRVGLGALTELSALSKPTIFIPMPGSHQEDNATMISQARAGIVVHQDKEVDTKLKTTLERLLTDMAEREQLGKKLHQFYTPGAVATMADQVLHLLKP